jgi:hypothetical protein
LWCSVVCRTSLRAILATLVLSLLLVGGHWIPWMCYIPFARHADKGMKFMVQMQGAVTPPVVVGDYLPHSPNDFRYYGSDPLWNPIWTMFVGVSGAGLWGLWGWFVWTRANQRFKKEGGRMDLTRPARYVPTDADGRRTPPGPTLYPSGEHAGKIQALLADGRIVEDTDSPG